MIGHTIRKLRNIYGFTAKDFSSSLGISNSYLSEIESEKKQPSLELIEKCARQFDMKPSSLLLLSEKYELASQNNGEHSIIAMMMKGLLDALDSEESSGK